MSDQYESVPEKEGWFDKKENVRKVLYGLYGACLFFILLDVVLNILQRSSFGLHPFFEKHPYFENWEKWPGFYAIYGFVACVVLVLISKFILRPLVMRSEDYYDKKEPKGGDDA